MSDPIKFLSRNQTDTMASGTGYYMNMFPTYTPGFSVSELELRNKRYPDLDADYHPMYVYNPTSTEINFVIEASGVMLIEPEKNGERATNVREGEMVIIPPMRPYAWSGMLRACLIHTDKYYKGQQIYLSRDQALKMLG